MMMAGSRLNVSPKCFQICSHIEILSVVGWTEDYRVTMGDLQPAQISTSECLTPFLLDEGMCIVSRSAYYAPLPSILLKFLLPKWLTSEGCGEYYLLF